MGQRLINLGEKVTGIPIPPSADEMFVTIASDPHTSTTEIDIEVARLNTERRRWWLDVAKCGVSDLVHFATGTHDGYSTSNQKERN